MRPYYKPRPIVRQTNKQGTYLDVWVDALGSQTGENIFLGVFDLPTAQFSDINAGLSYDPYTGEK